MSIIELVYYYISRIYHRILVDISQLYILLHEAWYESAESRTGMIMVVVSYLCVAVLYTGDWE